ncbi:MAG: ATP-binding protein [Bacteroidales bacterium]|uniref:ATP-binding protein n=1 Tax=Porphyromonas sp. TaxID=1924944 RepID=UPI00297A40C7|nr:ATP-binding protein [Porphyromonas sp.]MDD7438603.1 ATP-binding protein [Bacteroidales bacterium]MDY3067859.1 ATP-binding protein [Porphyromonas sp.]
MELTLKQKKEVTRSLDRYVTKIGSQSKAAKAMDIAASTLGAVLKGQYDIVSDEMLRKIESYTTQNAQWSLVETGAYKEITEVLTLAKEQCGVTWITADAGSGKSSTARDYADKVRNVYYILCNEDMRKRDFLDAICRAIGVYNYATRTLSMAMYDIVERLRKLDQPLLIFDEADKLSDQILNYFVQLYNELEDKAGMVFLSTPYIKVRMERGIRCNKRGFAELNSRIGRRFFVVSPTNAGDIYAICKANGIGEDGIIDKIVKDASGYDLDLRRVKKLVQTKR